MTKEHRRWARVTRLAFNLGLVTLFYYAVYFSTLRLVNPFGLVLQHPGYASWGPLLLGLGWIFGFAVTGVYGQVPGGPGLRPTLDAVVRVTVFALLAIVLAIFVLKFEYLSRKFMVVYMVGCFLLLTLARVLEWRLVAILRRLKFNALSVQLGNGRFALLGRSFFRGSLEQAGSLILRLAGRRMRHGIAVHVVNVHTLMEGRSDQDLGRAQDEADFLLPDGRPLSLAALCLGTPGAAQVRGPDLMRWLAREGRAPGLRHYFYGGVPGAAEATAASLSQGAPGLSVAGVESPPFGETADADLTAFVHRLDAARTDLLWLGLGAPKQEKLMSRLKRLGCPCVMIGVGAAFDYEAGLKREAPAWMRHLGLEWAFRLASEPGRLWKRYASTNPRFVGLLLCETLGLGPWRQGGVERSFRVAGGLCLVLGILGQGAALRMALFLSAGGALLLAAAARAATADRTMGAS